RLLGVISSLQVLSEQVIGKPEGRARIRRIRREVISIGAVPGRSAPAPAIGDRRAPWIVGPAIKSRRIIVSRHVAVVLIAVIVVAAVGSRIVAAVVVVGSVPVFVAASRVTAFGIAAVMSHADQSRVIPALGDDRPASMSRAVNRHAAGANGADVPSRI